MKKRKIKSFFNDADGFSAKDYLMLAFVSVFLLEHLATYVLASIGRYNSNLLTIVESLNPVVMTIIGGVFGVHAVREFTTSKGVTSKVSVGKKEETPAQDFMSQSDVM